MGKDENARVTISLTRKQLLDIQYAGVNSWGYEESGCPVCHTDEGNNHLDSCWIGAALKKADALEKKETRKP